MGKIFFFCKKYALTYTASKTYMENNPVKTLSKPCQTLWIKNTTSKTYFFSFLLHSISF